MRPALEAESPVRSLELDPDDWRRLRGYHLVSAKPMLVVLNVDESDLASVSANPPIADGTRSEVVVMSLPIEEEIAQLPEAEQQEFLAALDLEQASLDRADRLRNLQGAFSMARKNRMREAVAGRNVLLVDDVLTTGATASECARVLKDDGYAAMVVVIIVVRG